MYRIYTNKLVHPWGGLSLGEWLKEWREQRVDVFTASFSFTDSWLSLGKLDAFNTMRRVRGGQALPVSGEV